MWRWLRELREILSEPPVCQSCEVLKVELNAIRREKEILLDRILNPEPQSIPREAPTPVGMPARHIPWRVKQAELEAEDRRQKERILEEFKARTAKAEEVMGIKNG